MASCYFSLMLRGAGSVCGFFMWNSDHNPSERDMENSYNENCVDIVNHTVDYARNGDCVSLEESVSGSSGLKDYGIWRKEPGSVKERRERFLRGTGLYEFVNSELELSRMMNEVTSAKCLELERISECSGAVSCTSDSFVTRQEEDLFCCRKDPDDDFRQGSSEGLGTADEFEIYAQETIVQEVNGQDHDRSIKKEFKSWFENMIYKRKGGEIESNVSVKVPNTNRMKVHHYKKRYMECTAVYMGQEVQAHKGFIWTLKFSPDGQYLASGGEDGVIRIWCVTSTNSSCKYSPAKATSKFVDKIKECRIFPGRKSSNPAKVIIPEKVFRIEESPLQEFHGHTSDVLDLCWSKSNLLLSSSKDNTVRLWEVGCDECLQIFCHNNYVTCIQFNPMIDGYFISGSIDGKVRIWGIAESRVVDWADVRDIVTAICYKPDGQRFVVGTITGRCRFYASSGNQLQLEAQIRLQTKKKSSSNKITSFQFSPEDSQRLMITSADSKVRIFDGINIIHKYKGLRKSGGLFSGSFTSNGRHIVSVGEDSHVYVWNHDDFHDSSSKYTKSTSSCEHFFFQGVSVAIPWSSSEVQQIGELCSLQAPPERLETSSCLCDSERFSLGGWFSMDGLSRGSATWPEERLPLWDIPVTENDDHHHHQQPNSNTVLSATWGLVILTADCHGVIRTFHNYGLPVRL